MVRVSLNEDDSGADRAGGHICLRARKRWYLQTLLLQRQVANDHATQDMRDVLLAGDLAL